MAFLNVAAYGGSWAGGTVKNSSGALGCKVWTSSRYRKENPAPLVLMLHGCTQTAEELAAISGINALADKETFLVVYPEQDAAANPLRCWNWFDPKHQSRDVGEPALIAAVIHETLSSHNVDAQRVYAVGVSAGAAMTVVMGVTYPEIFAGLGVIIGAEYKAAGTVQEGLEAMKGGGPDPDRQGLLAFQTIQKSAGQLKKRMPVIAFHGAKDPYLNPVNTDQLIAQWAETNDYLDDGQDNDSVTVQRFIKARSSIPNGLSFTKFSYQDKSNHLLMEKWIVEGLGHAWPGSPITNTFADSRGPNATAEMWRFFGETSGSFRAKGEKQ